MSILTKRARVMAAIILMLLSCTGCTGMSWDDMKEKGKELLDQGEQINQQLVEEAEEINNNILFGDPLDSEEYENVSNEDFDEQ